MSISPSSTSGQDYNTDGVVCLRSLFTGTDASGAPLAGRFVPLHRYVIQSLDLMYAHLKNKTAVPPSQVVRTTPRGFQGNGTTPNNISASNEPPISAAPAAADQITFGNGTLHIPE